MVLKSKPKPQFLSKTEL